MTETVIVINSEDDFISISTNQKSILTRLQKAGEQPYVSQGVFKQYRVGKEWFRLLKSGLAIKQPKQTVKKIAVWGLNTPL